MTSVMAARVGAAGSVLALEPHPDIYAELTANLRLWQKAGGGAQITPHQIAFSDRAGTATLWTTEEFASNRGSASLTPETSVSRGNAPSDALNVAAHKGTEITMARLDAATDLTRPIDLLKIDVEGHELAVLEGSAGRLERGDIRDIIFEEHDPYPTSVTAYLGRHGYQMFQIGKRLWGPFLSDPDGPTVHNPFEPPSYLATRDPARARARLRPGRWDILKTRNLPG